MLTNSIRILQQLNNETRLQLDALPSTGTYLAGLRDARATAGTHWDGSPKRHKMLHAHNTVTDAFEGVNDAGQLIPVGFEAPDAPTFDLEALQTRIASRVANEALGAIRTAAEDANVTEQTILSLWEDTRPELETWYNELLEDANAIENEAESNEAVAALGSLPDFISNLKSQYVTPIVSRLRASTESLETRTANRLANDALGAIRTASEDANVTESAIVQLWTDVQPFLETWYGELLDDANSIENVAERTEAVAALGSLPDFVASLKSQYVTPVVTGLRRSAEALETRTATRLANDALGSIREAVADANVTESEIVRLWTDAQPLLETWYQELLDDANAIENDADRGEAVAALGSLPDFVASLKSQYVTPIVNGLRRSGEVLETRMANRVANDALGAIRTASEDANVTETEIVNLWTNAQPFIETWYQELLDDANAIENDAERNEALLALGSLPQFIASLKSQYVSPVISRLRSAGEALQTRTANRLANDALGAIREAAMDANVTESEIVNLWTDVQPFLETWYGELLDDANSIENVAERTEAVAALGSLPDFVANIKSQYVTPVITGIRSAGEALETRTANRLANDALGAIRTAAEDANFTEQTILDAWAAAQPSIQTWYGELLDDANSIENVAERTEAVAALGSLPQFIASLKSQYVTPIISRLQSSAEALETRTANRLANTALQAIRTASEDVNVTETEIVNLWTVAQPVLETWYNELLDDTNSIENDAERNEALAALGTPEAFIANLKSQYVTPIVNGIRSSAEALETRTATRLANAVLGSIRTASEDINVTEAEIEQLWIVSIPLIEMWYGELLDDVNAISNDAERTEALAALGTPEAFIGNLRSQYVTPIVSRLRSSAEALETRTANRLANEALGAISSAATDANVTESEIVNLWTTTTPLIQDWYNELLDDANAIENETERTEALAALGTPEAFIANLRSQYVMPVVTGIRRSAESLETQTANRVANSALGAIRTAAADVNITEAEIVNLWTTATPLILAWYGELLDDVNAIENDSERNEALAALGSPEAFIASLRSQYLTPVVSGLRRSGEVLETQTANRLASDALGAIGDAAQGVNTTVDQILSLWNEARPAIETWYNELRQDIETDISLSDAQRTEDLASLGNLSDFVSDIRNDTVAPFLNRLQSRGFQSRSNLGQNVVDRSRFLLSSATSQEEFDSERASLVRATNDYYNLEEDRISDLMSSEQELQDLREDNQLARIRSLREISELEFQSGGSRLDDIRLGSARSREDLDIGLGRSIQDLLREGLLDNLVGSTPSARELASTFQPGVNVEEIVNSGAFNKLFGGIGDLRRNFITEGIEDLLIPFGRGLEDIDRDTGRSEADFLSDIAIEESNNQWKSDIAAIATNTGQMDMLDPLLEPDLDRLDPLMPDTRDPLGVSEAGQMQLEMASGLEASAQAVTDSAAMLAASANHLMGAGDALYGSAAHLASLTIPVPAGGGGGETLNGRALAQIVNDANVSLGAEGGIVGGGGGNGGGV